MASESLDPLQVNQSRLISTVLSPALRFWLRSQVESVTALEFQIEGGDRQLVSGHIPRVTIAATDAVYQGIAIGDIRLVGQNIRINLRQVLRGKPLQLLEVIPVQAEAILRQTDLMRSVETPLLQTALTDLLLQLAHQSAGDLPPDWQALLAVPTLSVQHPQIQLATDQIWIGATLGGAEQSRPFVIQSGLKVVDRSQLHLVQPCWHAGLSLTPAPGILPQPVQPGIPLPQLEQHPIDLGRDVTIQELALQSDRVLCRGILSIVP